jgi:lysophospholipase L1-like esterase
MPPLVRFKSLRIKLLLALAMLLVAALGAELYLRIWRPVGFLDPDEHILAPGTDWTQMVHVPSKTPGLLYEVAPHLDVTTHGMHIITNSLGMRDDEPLPRDTPHLVRIAALGDSFTFGFTVDQGQDFPAQLEKRLNELEPEHQRRFDVLNFGVGGYTTWDEAVVLQRKALPFDPDMIVIGYCLNDPEYLPVQGLHNYFHETWWWQHSHLLRLFASRLQGWRIKKYGHGSYFHYIHSPQGECWPRVAKAFDDIRGMCASKKLPVVLVIFPMQTGKLPPWSSYPYKDIHAYVAAEAAARGFHVVDTLDAVSKYEPKDIVISRDDSHLSPLGNRLVAEQAEAVIRPLLENAGR